MNVSLFRIFALTALAILAFAGNSLLTRAAFTQPSLGPGVFAGVRLLSGALMLALIGAFRSRLERPRAADIPGAIFLAGYAVAFTYAYVEIGAAPGALVLFAAVQISMIAITMLRGGKIAARALLGVALAFAGLVWLLAPGSSVATPKSVVLMMAAGISWGFYTLAGRGTADPLATTTRNFVATVPLALLLLTTASTGMSQQGLILAIVSGAFTSALGYAIWYAVLPDLPVATSGAAQLLVPPVAAAMAWGWLDEPLSGRLVASAALILTGIALTILPAKTALRGMRRQ